MNATPARNEFDPKVPAKKAALKKKLAKGTSPIEPLNRIHGERHKFAKRLHDIKADFDKAASMPSHKEEYAPKKKYSLSKERSKFINRPETKRMKKTQSNRADVWNEMMSKKYPMK